MTRRLLLLIPLAACFGADAAKDAAAVIADAANELSNDRAEPFLSLFDRNMPGYNRLSEDVVGLMSEANLSCSIEVNSNEGDEGVRNLTLDWILRLDPKDGNPVMKNREVTAKCQLRKVGKNWRIVSFEPLDLFEPS